jgi:hypothetical protein
VEFRGDLQVSVNKIERGGDRRFTGLSSISGPQKLQSSAEFLDFGSFKVQLDSWTSEASKFSSIPRLRKLQNSAQFQDFRSFRVQPNSRTSKQAQMTPKLQPLLFPHPCISNPNIPLSILFIVERFSERGFLQFLYVFSRS